MEFGVHRSIPQKFEASPSYKPKILERVVYISLRKLLEPG